jgi:hypothetical protein
MGNQLPMPPPNLGDLIDDSIGVRMIAFGLTDGPKPHCNAAEAILFSGKREHASLSSEFVIPPKKRIAEGSRRPGWRVAFLLVLFFGQQRKEHKKHLRCH